MSGKEDREALKKAQTEMTAAGQTVVITPEALAKLEEASGRMTDEQHAQLIALAKEGIQDSRQKRQMARVFIEGVRVILPVLLASEEKPKSETKEEAKTA